jgi:hypothetical protein
MKSHMLPDGHKFKTALIKGAYTLLSKHRSFDLKIYPP